MTDANLPTPKEYNVKFMNNFARPVKAPVKCPDCGTQMENASVGVVLASYPAQITVHCPKCGKNENIYCL